MTEQNINAPDGPVKNHDTGCSVCGSEGDIMWRCDICGERVCNSTDCHVIGECRRCYDSVADKTDLH